MPTGIRLAGAQFAEGGDEPGVRRGVILTKNVSYWVSDLGWSPNTDIFETEQALVIRLELAGVQRDHMEITLRENTLTIRGYRHTGHQAQRVYFHQAEISYGPFEKVLVLPERVVPGAIEARYREGFLEITIDKNEGSLHQAREVQIED
ncbi:MAG: Hsp20/alpha crystallin family protein [candidate division KSB1 bacterium]|nr:Hsp20/alpha crystallin family protein [candidate division KSB1 bacterium]MDZ7337994.1 Hsp20/alpha crystallin family protein [candidate division KSB1 bacterium]MDZ7384971.1 Hsp20/alpha crystallin family protein [candidate division KSB1 bacterium]MDZ7391545.1 Hsp20/alpha crystallin family protein [candidate division KSB1 bacterium]MDZ7412289.1 Hsp20/alpha crystallin family protein [candidate division KSB1 bacterium]